jgi:hypothetical protein
MQIERFAEVIPVKPERTIVSGLATTRELAALIQAQSYFVQLGLRVTGKVGSLIATVMQHCRRFCC